LIALVFMLYLLLVVPSIVQGQTVGVQEGDWFKWSYSYSFSDEQPIPAQFDIEWVKFLVTDISGTLVTGEATIKYNNGTEHTEPSSIDVDNDIEPIIKGMLISTHYSEGDDINNIQHLDIWEIVTVTYLDQPRDMFYSYFAAWSDVSGVDEEYYWDKQTGILVEMTVHQRYSEDSGNLFSGTSTFELKLIESNVPGIPEFSTQILIGLFIVVTLLAIAISRQILEKNNHRLI